MRFLSTFRPPAAPSLIVFLVFAGLVFAPAAIASPWTQVDTFGDVGNGEFRAPYAIAADAAGQLYVVENDMHRVQKLDANGAFLASWGGQGGAEGEFSYPTDIAVDAAGGVYVADQDNDRIEKFNTDGEFVSAWGWGVADGSAAYQICTTDCRPGMPGNGPGQFSNPAGIATDGVNVYVADLYNMRVQKFDPAGAKVGQWAIPGGQRPERLTVAGGKVYVTTRAHMLWRFHTGGVPDSGWDGDGVTGSPGSGAGQLNDPEAVAVDATGVYVADSDNHRISKFDLNGAFTASWGVNGVGDGEFGWPYGIAATGGSLWVADTYNHRLQKLSTAGSHQLTVGAPPGAGDFYFPSDVAAASGGVYVADYSPRDIQRLDGSGNALARWGTGLGNPYSVTPTANGMYVPESGDRVGVYDSGGTLVNQFAGSGSALGQLSYPAGSAADAEGNLYVAERSNHRVQKFSAAGAPLATFGSYGSGDGQLNTPRDVAIDSAGDLYVTDGGNHRIVKFSPAGQFLAKWGSLGSGDGQFQLPEGVAVDTSGHVFVSDRDNNRIQEFSADGGFIAKWGTLGNGPGELSGPEGLSVDSAGALWVADSDNHRIVRFCCPGAGAGPGPTGDAPPPPPPPPPGANPGTADTVAPGITLGGRRVQRLGLVRRRGLGLRIGTNERAAATLRASVGRRQARRLGLRSVVVARSTTELATAGARGTRLRLTPRARRALLRTRKLRIVVRATAADTAGNRSSASFAITVVR
jgi:sugar lactone lactonase YvrE